MASSKGNSQYKEQPQSLNIGDDDVFLDFGPDSHVDARDFFDETDYDAVGTKGYKNTAKKDRSKSAVSSMTLKVLLATMIVAIGTGVGVPVLLRSNSTGNVINQIKYSGKELDYEYVDDLPYFENISMNLKGAHVSVYDSSGREPKLTAYYYDSESDGDVFNYEVKKIDGVETLVVSLKTTDYSDGIFAKSDSDAPHVVMYLPSDKHIDEFSIDTDSDRDIYINGEMDFGNLQIYSNGGIHLYDFTADNVYVQSEEGEISGGHFTAKNLEAYTVDEDIFFYDAYVTDSLKCESKTGDITGAAYGMKDGKIQLSTSNTDYSTISLYTDASEEDFMINVKTEGSIYSSDSEYYKDKFSTSKGAGKISINEKKGSVYLRFNEEIED